MPFIQLFIPHYIVIVANIFFRMCSCGKGAPALSRSKYSLDISIISLNGRNLIPALYGKIKSEFTMSIIVSYN